MKVAIIFWVNILLLSTRLKIFFVLSKEYKHILNKDDPYL